MNQHLKQAYACLNQHRPSRTPTPPSREPEAYRKFVTDESQARVAEAEKEAAKAASSKRLKGIAQRPQKGIYTRFKIALTPTEMRQLTHAGKLLCPRLKEGMAPSRSMIVGALLDHFYSA